jgi:hypothetical protein
MKHKIMESVVAVGIALGAISLHAAPAAALGPTIDANVSFTNNSSCPITLQNANCSAGIFTDSPPTTVQPNQTVHWQSSSNNSIDGTGGASGSVQIVLPTSQIGQGNDSSSPNPYLDWDIPWSYINGLWGGASTYVDTGDGNQCYGASCAIPNGAWVLTLNVDGCGEDDCEFDWTLSLQGGISDCGRSTTESSAGSWQFPPASPSMPAALSSYWDSAHNTEYVFYQDFSGNLDALSCGVGGCWASRQIAQAGVMNAGSSLVSYFDGTNGHVFFQGSLGSTDIIELTGNPPTTSSLVDITSQTHSAPAASFTVYTNNAAHSIGGIVGASNMTGFWDGSTPHIFYSDASMNVHESYYAGQWWDHIVAHANALSSGIPLGTLRSVWDGTNEHVMYPIGTYNPQESTTTLTGIADTTFPASNWTPAVIVNSSVPLPAYDFVAFGEGGGDLLFGGSLVSTDQVDELGNIGNGWGSNDFSTGNIGMGPYTPLLFYQDSKTDNLFFIGSSQHVYMVGPFSGTGIVDMSTSPGNDNALVGASTQGGVGVTIDAESPLTGFFDGSQDHVFFVDTHNDIEEFYWSPGATYITEHVVGGGGNVPYVGITGSYQQ